MNSEMDGKCIDHRRRMHKQAKNDASFPNPVEGKRLSILLENEKEVRRLKDANRLELYTKTCMSKSFLTSINGQCAVPMQ